MFPKFLFASSVFQTKKRNAEASSPNLPSILPIDELSKNRYLQGHISCIRCSTCAAHLCLTTQIISKGFTGRHGRAYLISAEPTVNAPSYPGESLPNTLLQNPVSRHLVTGAHTVSDVDCFFCGNVLGWKYISAEEESQRYKVGKFILETKKIMTTPEWDPAFAADLVEFSDPPKSTVAPSKSIYDGIEFDSQDEDECEDLFSGIWSPGLAMRRKNRRIARQSSTLGPVA